jgi:hypothetical protein
MGCQYAQGFYFSPPLTADQVSRMNWASFLNRPHDFQSTLSSTSSQELA